MIPLALLVGKGLVWACTIFVMFTIASLGFAFGNVLKNKLTNWHDKRTLNKKEANAKGFVERVEEVAKQSAVSVQVKAQEAKEKTEQFFEKHRKPGLTLVTEV